MELDPSRGEEENRLWAEVGIALSLVPQSRPTEAFVLGVVKRGGEDATITPLLSTLKVPTWAVLGYGEGGD